MGRIGKRIEIRGSGVEQGSRLGSEEAELNREADWDQRKRS